RNATLFVASSLDQRRSRERHLADAFAGCGVDGVVKSRSKRWNAGLSHASRRSIALDGGNAGVLRSAVHAHDLIVIEMALVHWSMRKRDLAQKRETCAEAGSSFELVANIVGCYDSPGVHSSPHIRDSYLAVVVNHYFDDGGNIR